MSTSNKKLAVLIDADNAPADSIEAMLEEIAKYGIASVKRIYGDWSHGLSKWKAVLLPHAIIPVQQFAYTKGKNATDMALVIDAMDLLYSGNVDGFCIVSSDSDFTRLASRIRESGLTVYGFGEKKTPESFRRACDKFVYIEIFRPQKNQSNQPKNPNPETTQPENKANAHLLNLIKRAVKENADDLGWAHLASIGSYINKINPDFDARLYGFSKLSDLIKSFDLFEHRTDNSQLQIRRKKADNPKTETKNHSPNNQTKSSENQSDKKQNPVSGSLKNTEAAETPKTQKQRGRPKKSQTKDTPNHPETTTETPVVVVLEQPSAPESQKQRGRPKKQKSASETETSVSGSLKNKVPFAKIILAAQTAVDAAADSSGWARFGDVAKHLEQHNNLTQLGFASARDLLHAVYADWLTIQKIGRGERVRVNKRFINKE